MAKTSIYSRYFTYIKPVSKIPVIKNYGSIIFTLLSTSLLVIFAIRPTVETILVLQKKLQDQEVILQKINQKAEDLSQGKKNFDNMEYRTKDKISNAIPNTLNIKSLISSLEQAALANQASVSALQVQPLIITNKEEGILGKLEEASFTFNVEGEYQKLLNFLNDLKNSKRLISIDNISMAKTNSDTSLIISLSGKAFFLK